MNVVNYTLESELTGGTRHAKNQLTVKAKNICNSNHFSSRLPYVLKEHEIDLKSTNLNKIFTGQWLDERRCIMGTKCNNLLVMDTVTGKYSVQTPLKSPPESKDIQNHCGIHSISINPSRTLLATGASNVNDVAIYSLPHLEPVAVGFKAHSYWIFDLAWLNDEYVVSGSGDNRLALWKTTPSSTSSPLKSMFSNSITSRNKHNKHNTSNPTALSQEEYNASACAALNLINKQKQSYLTDRWLKRPFSYSFSAYAATSTNNSSPAHRLTSSFLMPSSFAPIPNRLISFLTSSPNTSRISRNDGDTSDSDSDDNDDDDDDDDDEDERSRDSDSDQSMSSNGDHNQSFNFHTAPTSSSNSNLIIFDEWSSVNSNIEEDDQFGNQEEDEDDEEESSEDNLDGSSHRNTDDQDGEHNRSFEVKRQRLNHLGKFRFGSSGSRGGASSHGGLNYLTPTKVIKCRQSKRIRALAFNPKRNEIAAISMNSAFHYFDIHRFEQKYTKKLSMLKENVCLSLDSDYSTYAIGSASHVQLLDANNAVPIVEPVFVKKDIGIRSLHFRNKVLSVGTGMGSVLFYDLRVNKFLPSSSETESSTEPYKLQTTGGWILRNQTYYENLPFGLNNDNSHAIYSHSYDPSGTKMLTVGGPLTVNLYGNYMGIWR